jgi:predicted RNA-binding Zn ribbon-like protein
MTVTWTEHRFSGGALALDTANTVVMRGDARGFDRFDDVSEIARFAAAASRFRRDELDERTLLVPEPVLSAPAVLELREAIDALFRADAAGERRPAGALPRLLRACANALDGADEIPAGGDRPDSVPFLAAVANSALALLPEQKSGRIRICGNCGWLFVDRSRNASRLWCDMAVCGNRQKARRHYRRRRTGAETDHA